MGWDGIGWDGRHTPPGSSVSFVELSGNKGWIVESAKERAVLEKSLDGQFIVENITGRGCRACSGIAYICVNLVNVVPCLRRCFM